MRLRTALGELYDYFVRNEKLVANVLRDAETHALLREIGQIRRGPRLAAYMETLGQGMTAQQRGVLQLALSFHAWRMLVRQSGLDHDAAIRVMIYAIACAAQRVGIENNHSDNVFHEQFYCRRSNMTIA